jgi:hypothetical protein
MRSAANCIFENAYESRQSVEIQVLLELDKRDLAADPYRVLRRRSDA